MMALKPPSYSIASLKAEVRAGTGVDERGRAERYHQGRQPHGNHMHLAAMVPEDSRTVSMHTFVVVTCPGHVIATVYVTSMAAWLASQVTCAAMPLLCAAMCCEAAGVSHVIPSVHDCYSVCMGVCLCMHACV